MGISNALTNSRTARTSRTGRASKTASPGKRKSVKTGSYRVDLYYTCPKADIGSTIELSFNDSRLSGTIVEPHDPPIKGAEHDRVERQESYVKDFQPMTLGIVRLEKGTGTLTLKATKLAGSQAMDFRLLMLKRVD